MTKRNINGTWFVVAADGTIIKGGFLTEEAIDKWLLFMESLPSNNYIDWEE